MVKALCWEGAGRLAVRDVPEPRIRNDQDMIVKVTATTACGSDLHLIDGHVPAMRRGEVLGHEFVGEVVETGPAVRRHKVGDRVVVCSVIGCGRCWYCADDQWSLCDNGNPDPDLGRAIWGYEPGAAYGHSRAMGGFRGAHAEYVRVPFADYGAFPVPDEVDDISALFVSDSAPTGWMGAHLGGVKPGDVVAVWGCGAVGQMAACAAALLGADRVIAIDRHPERLAMAAEHAGAETIDYTATDVCAELRERTGGRGPDVCIEAAGMQAQASGLERFYDGIERRLRRRSDRSSAVREAVYACRKGGSVFVLGFFTGTTDKFPLGALMNKGLTLRAARTHGQRYIPMLLQRIARGELDTRHLATHRMPLKRAPRGYELFKHRKDGCVRVVFHPAA
ncbi:zinc-dependent alcohol dehydrogenase [Thermomonospora curvata]|uniref:Alcohol dehydrogenase GroES domain protein n=1 Tax=Thermomonospora curvata (strain ATCC 19995 / DSM 43183 / JCM 3096 / KCTC 9072 / NBRC 15933 / NCIMB 10081 / Henssen B9) TaxID=471852 RepID=D1A9G8_THECD|nr:zinc-dependent alcohol dehydrogenase [Thermomonospora curvata]ACY96864.1 Alcohol dehydrogenase GroES domain protein [Thermomonospora curvata DSM 43183]